MELMKNEAHLVGADGHKPDGVRDEHLASSAFEKQAHCENHSAASEGKREGALAKVANRVRWTRTLAISAATATSLILKGASATQRTATPRSAARVRPTATAFVSVRFSRRKHIA
jgi:hypothetical protein